MQASGTNPRQLAASDSQRMRSRRVHWRQAKNRSTSPRRWYRRRCRPSWILSLRVARCGAIWVTPS